MTSMTTTTWTFVDDAHTRRARATLDALLNGHGYATVGAWRHSDGRTAVVYSDPAVHGLFAVRVEDAAGAHAFDSYSEWCDSTFDLADADLARQMRADAEAGTAPEADGTLKYSGACSPVLVVERWSITNRSTGYELGQYPGTSPEEALDAMSRDAGYRDFEHSCEVIGKSVDDARADLAVTEAQP